MAMRRDDVGSGLNELSDQIIAAAIEVHRHLGPGFQESTYHRALCIELRRRQLVFEVEVPVSLEYKGESIGEGRVDVLVEQRVVVELKSAEGKPDKFRRQVVAYLKATSLPLGLIINFNASPLHKGVLRVANSKP